MGSVARNVVLATGCTLAAAALTAAEVLLVAPRHPHAASDADQVRTVLNRMNGSYNRSDFAGFASHLCPDMLGADYAAGWYRSRQTDGPTRITVNSVHVTGDDAVANVRFVAANHEDPKILDIDFLRDGDQWKACRYHVARAV